MTSCAIKVCRNYKGRLKTTKEVTYHRIPNDPVLRSRWIEIIRKSRGEEVWQPAKTTVICSEHFRAKDLVNNNNRRRLKKEAIPSRALILAPLEIRDDDESDDLLEETEKKSECVTNVLSDPKSLGQVTCSKNGDGQKKENEIDKDFSDLDSILDTPEKSKMRQDLRRRIQIQKKHSFMIQSLRRKNLRLKKKIAFLKEIIETLKQERYVCRQRHS